VCLRGLSVRRAEKRSPASTDSTTDLAPLSPRQLQALLRGVARELIWGLPAVVRELHEWRTRAAEIPNQIIRQDALSALDRKRGNTHGAALFWTLPRTRSRCLLRLLVTYQVMWDFLDCVSESGAGAGQANGLQLHLALVDALDPRRPVSDYYALHPWYEDGGYLRALVETSRQCCRELPSFQSIRPLLVREAMRASVQAINHDLDPVGRQAALQEWVAREYPNEHEVAWFELAGAAGAGLAIYALLALAAEPACDEEEITRVYGAYFPWTSAVATMLDSFVDQAEDQANNDHCYVAYYQTPEHATKSISQLVRRCLQETHTLRNSEGHTLIAACMVAMYLSKDSARTEAMRAMTASLLCAGGQLTRFLLPILRLWRILNAQRST
jgi:tetraprenyl-beta-curcumene synthase